MFVGLKRRIAHRIDGFLRYYTTPHTMNESLDLLRATGMQIGEGTVIYDCSFDPLYPWLISIGADCTLTGVQIIVHDDSPILFVHRRHVARVRIGNRVFIGRGAIILPGVEIGSDVIVGAGAVVSKHIPDGSVVVGNPCRVIGNIADVCHRKAARGTLLPYHFQSNLVTGDEDAKVQAVVKEWMVSNRHNGEYCAKQVSSP